MSNRCKTSEVMSNDQRLNTKITPESTTLSQQFWSREYPWSRKHCVPIPIHVARFLLHLSGRVGKDLQFCSFLELALTQASTENKPGIGHSRIWRLRECASSSPIFLVSLASSFRSSSWATFRSSFVHASK